MKAEGPRRIKKKSVPPYEIFYIMDPLPNLGGKIYHTYFLPVFMNF